MRLAYYGGSVEFFFVVFTGFLVLTTARGVSPSGNPTPLLIGGAEVVLALMLAVGLGVLWLLPSIVTIVPNLIPN